MKIVLALFLGHIQSIKLQFPYGDFENERDESSGYPSLPIVGKHKGFVNEYIEKNTGRFKTPYEVELDRASASQKKLEGTYKKNSFVVPDNMINDWTGNRYIKHPYGFLQLSAQINGDDKKEEKKDDLVVKPARMKKEDDDKKAKDEEDKRTPEQKAKSEERADKNLQSAVKNVKSTEVVPEFFKMNPQQKENPTLEEIQFQIEKERETESDKKKSDPPEENIKKVESFKGPMTFKIGDLQEHRYIYPQAMEPNALLPEEQSRMNSVDNAHKIIYDHYIPETGRFKHPAQIEMEKEEDEERKQQEEGYKAFKAKDYQLDDWTGTRFATNILCYGREPCEKNKKK